MSSRRQAHHRTMKRQGSNTSSFNRQHQGTRCKTALNVLSEGEANLSHYLHKLGLPSGLHASIEEMYSAMESRIWIVDNSLGMNVRDCALLLADDDLTTIIKEEGHSRWTEQLQVVDFHMKMAARTWIPTKFWMTNAPQNEAQRYGVCWGEPETWSSKRDLACQKILKTIKPERVSNPLGREICKIIQQLKAARRHTATWVKEERKFVSVVICTQGVPTDEFGETSSEVTKECIKSFKALSELRVKIVFRLCTRDKKVINFYKKVDMDIDCDVLRSYWDEAVEVYQYNSWLTYGIGLHRIREAGLGSDIMDCLDERPLSTSELYDWCSSMFVGDNDLVVLRHPAKDWSGFITDVKEFLKDEQMVWNPMKKKLCPWIDVARLETIYQPRRPRPTSFHQERHSSQARRHTESDVDTTVPHQSCQESHSLYARRHTQSEVETVPCQQGVKKQPVRRVSDGEPPPMNCKSSSFQDQPSAPSESSRLAESGKRSSKSFHARPRDPEPVSLDSSSSKPRLVKRQTSSFHDSLKSSVIIKQELQDTLFGVFDERSNERSLSTVIKEWSREPNGKLRPVQMLLFEAPVLLPPNNPLVEHHKYFDKWKALHRDAFKDGEGGAADDEVIRKLARRCKMFLHPDKWPTDLNEDQKLLLQTIWDTLSESALF